MSRRKEPTIPNELLDQLLAGGAASAAAQALLAEADEDPTDLAALDAAYAEAQVTFGPDPNAGCPATREMLARMDMPPAASSRATAR